VVETGDPGHHRALAELVALGTVGVVFDVEGSGQRPAVCAPAAAVGDEIAGLRRAAGIVGQREVVGATDKPGLVRPVVLGSEVGIDEPEALGRLDIGKLRPVGRDRVPVDAGLVTADIQAELRGCRRGGTDAEKACGQGDKAAACDERNCSSRVPPGNLVANILSSRNGATPSG
jgi:hypothetical protein